MDFRITGMSCAACSARVEKVVSALPDVTSCSVNLLTASMKVSGSADSKEIIKAVESAGYGAFLNDGNKVSFDENTNLKKLATRLYGSVVLLLILMLFSMGPLGSKIIFVQSGFVQAVLAIVVMGINYKFFTNGIKGFVKLSPNMDSLVALGSSASFLYSLYILINSAFFGGNGGHLYFEGAAMIVTLITVGKLLEEYSKGKTTNAIKSLMKIAPKTAVLIRMENGTEKEVEVLVDEVHVGDIFAVRPGQNIPVDGVVIEGNASVDESSISGESIPVDKECGDEVISATTNLDGFMKCRAVKVGKDTAFSKIIEMVMESAATKAPAQKIADKVAGIFVPVVLGIAAVTFSIWFILGKGLEFSLLRGVSILLISCPCALGLATPVAIMVGNGVGAKHGILFKNSIALEKTGKAKTVILDKTGTITKGKISVKEVLADGENSVTDVLQYALDLENKSSHPVAKAIVKKALEMKLKIESISDFKEIPGQGVSTLIDDHEIFCGRKSGYSSIVVTKDGKLVGRITVQDEIKEDSAAAVLELKKLGLKVVMLTGDNRKNAEEVARVCGIAPNDVVAEVKPEQKAAVVKETCSAIMVGDGINDAPALAAAATGIAIGAGSDVAIDSAGVVLVKNSLMDVVHAIRLSRNVNKNIKQNLFWAFFYNVIGIPLAAGCYTGVLGWTLNPMVCAVAMSVSSFCVVMNALRLNLLKI